MTNTSRRKACTADISGSVARISTVVVKLRLLVPAHFSNPPPTTAILVDAVSFADLVA